MGGNQFPTRTYGFVYFALLIVVGVSGCANVLDGVKGPTYRAEIRNHIDQAKKLFEQGNYEASLKENEKALSVADGKSPADEALFHMGVTTAYSRNPQKDYAKSLVYFERLVREYPESKLIEQAKIWVQVLQEHQRVIQEKKALLQEKQILTQEKMALAREKDKLKQAIEQSRKVDVEIEEKRRKKRVP